VTRAPPHAADALGWVAGGFDHGAGLLGRVHHGYQDGLHTQIQVALDDGHARMAMAHRHTGHRVCVRVARDGLQLTQDGGDIVGGVLAIHQHPVKTCARTDLGGVGIGQTQPQTDLQTLFVQGLFEGIDGIVHGEGFVRVSE